MNHSFTATPKDVERAFATVFPHVGKERHYPVLTVVHVELEPTVLRLVATDRYTLAVYRADLEEWLPKDVDFEPVDPLEVNIFASDLRRLFAFARSQKKDPARWSLSEHRLEVELGDGSSLSIKTVDVGKFIAYRPVLEAIATRPAERSEYLAASPTVLARFTASAEAMQTSTQALRPLIVWGAASPLKPTPVTIGDRFLGLLMPVRTDEAPTLDIGPFVGAAALPAGGAQ